MKRILGIAALTGLLTAAPAAFAGVDFSIGFFLPAPAPVYVAPAPVYVAPAPVYVAPPGPPVVYFRTGTYWRGGHEYYEHREYRERFEHGRGRGRGWD